MTSTSNRILRYAVYKALAMFLVFFVSLTVFFFFFRIAPVVLGGGNPLAPAKAAFDPLIAASGSALQGNPAAASWIGYISGIYGLDKPLFPDQLLLFYRNIFTFNFGNSLYTFKPVSHELLMRLPYTLVIYLVGVLAPILIGYSLAVYSVKNRGRIIDILITLSSLFSYVVPSYVALLLLYYLLGYIPKVTIGIKIFPLPTRAPLVGSGMSIEDLFYLAWYVTPIYLALILTSFGQWSYYLRQLLVSEAEKDYVISARAVGLREDDILKKEITPNIRPPLITSLGYTIPTIFGGSIVLEMLSSWPGVATYAYNAMSLGDFPVIVGFYTISALLLVVSIYIADLLVILLDPRVRIVQR